MSTTENLITPEQLVTDYLYGLNLSDDDGVPFPDSMFERAIRVGVDRAEKKLDIAITPIEFNGSDDPNRPKDVRNASGQFGSERHPFNPGNPYATILLNKRPLIGYPTAVKLIYPGQTESFFEYPSSWVQVRSAISARINIMAGVGSVTTPLVAATGILPSMYYIGQTTNGIVPDMVRVDYRAGFEEGTIPPLLNHMIALYASMNILNPAGDLIVGAGIASKSISMDGLSETVNTTSSATSAGYGSRLLRYDDELKQITPVLLGQYKGHRISMI